MAPPGDQKLVSQIFHHSKHLCFEPSQQTKLLYAFLVIFQSILRGGTTVSFFFGQFIFFIFLNIFALSIQSLQVANLGFDEWWRLTKWDLDRPPLRAAGKNCLHCDMCIGWHITMCKTFRWLQKKSSILAWPVLTWPGESWTYDFKPTGGFAQRDVSPCRLIIACLSPRRSRSPFAALCSEDHLFWLLLVGPAWTGP